MAALGKLEKSEVKSEKVNKRSQHPQDFAHAVALMR